MRGGLARVEGVVMDDHGDTAGLDTFSLEGGTLDIGLWGIQGNISSRLLFGGGWVTAHASWSSTLPIELTGTNGPVVFDTAGHVIQLPMVMEGAGGFIKIGPGTLALGSASNSYAGGTTVVGGTLRLEAPLTAGRGALPPGRPVDLQPGSTLLVAVHDALGVGSGAITNLLLDEATLSIATGLHANVGAIALHGGFVTAEGSGTFVLDGPLSTVAHELPSIVSTSTLSLRGGPATSSVAFAVARGTAAVDLRIDSTMSGSGFNKTGPGVLELAGVSALAAPVTVSNGTLVVSGRLGTNGLTVAAGGTLKGTGVVAGAVTSEGVIAPGLPIGSLAVQGPCTLGAASALHIDLGGTSPGSTCDRLTLDSPITLGGALVVTFTNGFAPSTQDVFAILTAPAILGTFESVSIEGGGAGWGVLYQSNAVVLAVTNAGALDTPVIVRLPDIVLSSPTSAIPAPDTASLVTVSTCGTLTVTWAGDVTNAGSGCAGAPRVITRTYAVASSCGTTSTCSQFLVLEDTTPPLVSLLSGTAANLGFEEATSTVWRTFGASGQVSIGALGVRTGSGALSLGVPPASRVAVDSGPAGSHGVISTSAVPWQAAAVPALGHSMRFGAPGSVVSAGAIRRATNSLTITTWLMLTSNQLYRSGLIGSRVNTTNYSGLCMGVSNVLGYEWFGATNARTWTSGPTLATGQWAFVALTVGPDRAVIHLRTPAGWTAATNNVTHIENLLERTFEIGGDPTVSRQVSCLLNDVQVYDRMLTFAEVSDLWNGGAGNTTSTGLLRRWKLNDTASIPTSQSLGVYQDVAARTGQTWIVGAWATVPSDNPLNGGNYAALYLQFLNTNGVPLSTTSVSFLSSPYDVPDYKQIVGSAPLGTAAARMMLRYNQDSGGSSGIICIDDCVFGSLYRVAGNGTNQCGTLSDYRADMRISAYDAFSGTNLVWTQVPPAGSPLTSNRMEVLLRAADACGNTGSVSFVVDVVDRTPPSFSVSPATSTLGCPTALPTNVITHSDNCGVRNIVLVSSVTNGGTGCGTSPSVITNLFELTDLGGNVSNVTQVVTRLDNSAPTIDVKTYTLSNPSFESGMGNWSLVGPITQQSMTPRTGTRSVQFAPPSNGIAASMTHTTPATGGQPWRFGAWVRRPEAEPAPSGSALELRLNFLNAALSSIAASTSSCEAISCLPDTYRQVSLSATAPSGSAYVAATLACVTNAGPTCPFVVDDVRLSPLDRTLDDFGTTTLPALLSFTAFTETCSQIVSAQLPVAGTVIGPGTNLARVSASDACLNARTTVVQIVGIDETPPALIAAPPDQVVAQIGDIPPPSLALVSAVDACSAVTVTNLPDLVGSGAGTTNDPLLVTRRYRATDVTGNVAEYRQTFYVGAALPTGYRLYAAGIPNAFAQGISDDPDGDGFANLLEYVTGGGATNADQMSALRGLRAGGGFSLVFSRATGAVDAILVVEGSHGATNNAAWQGLATNLNGSWGGATNVLETGTGTPVTVTVVDPLTGATNRFLRLKVSLP